MVSKNVHPVFVTMLLLTVILARSALVMSDTVNHGMVSRSELDALKPRLERLEEIFASQQKVIKRQRARLISLEEGDFQTRGSFEKGHPSWSDKIHIGGLIEVGAGWQNSKSLSGRHEAKSDITLATVEIHMDADMTHWINVESVLLYEDPLFGDDDHDNLDVDEAALTLGNTEKFPFYASIGKMYVPFGALLTHFPDDPFTDSPMTLLLGETSEKSLLFGFEKWGLSVSGYVFNGELEKGEEDHVEDFGFDLHYKGNFVPTGHVAFGRGEKYVHEPENSFDYLIGFSFISNIAESDGLTGLIEDNLGSDKIIRSVPGIDAYFHTEYRGIFLDVEYMGATRSFKSDEISWRGSGAHPKVWNLEAGFNYNWWRNLEVAFKYAGSDEMAGFPKSRFGICFNQEIFDNVIASIGYTHDEYDNHDRAGDLDHVLDKKDFIFWQVAAEF